MRPRTPALVWLTSAAAAGVLHATVPRWFGERTSWGANEGWQREIAVFDLGLVLTAAHLAREGGDTSDELQRLVLPLASLLGINHLVGGLHEPRRWGHWFGVAGNAAGVALALSARRARPPR